MKLTLNGTPRDVPEGLTVRALIEHLGLGGGPVAVEINREIVPRAMHAERAVQEVAHRVFAGA